MIPCCDLCYKPHLDDEGRIDEIMYSKAVDNFVEWLKKQKESKNTGIQEERITQAMKRRCTCACHHRHESSRRIIH